MELQGQTAIVTGAGRNIGRAIALELAGMGADVVVAEVDRATGERTAEEVRKRGRRAMALQTDVTRLADLQAMADQTVAEWGRIDILVNNAGIHKSMHTADVTEAEPGLDGGQDGAQDLARLRPHQGGGDQHDPESGSGPRRRRHPRQLRLPRHRGDRHDLPGRP
jgi:NAD(P)-dependent dehydrogenase (short-subunit alcohol dehydrogenase family)